MYELCFRNLTLMDTDSLSQPPFEMLSPQLDNSDDIDDDEVKFPYQLDHWNKVCI